jgi:hypothetical protein
MRARSLQALLIGGALLLASGCVRQSTYHWGRYDDTLYRHYKKPAEREAFVEGLRTTILEADEQGLRVPPGICAEYGYALYEEGRLPEAISFFQRERTQWPESQVLMDKMIRNAELRAGKKAGPPALAPAAATGAAGALEQSLEKNGRQKKTLENKRLEKKP